MVAVVPHGLLYYYRTICTAVVVVAVVAEALPARRRPQQYLSLFPIAPGGIENTGGAPPQSFLPAGGARAGKGMSPSGGGGGGGEGGGGGGGGGRAGAGGEKLERGGAAGVSRDAVKGFDTSDTFHDNNNPSSRALLEQEVRARGSDPERPAVSYLLDLYRKLEDSPTEGTDRRLPVPLGTVIKALTPSDSRRHLHHRELSLSFNMQDVGTEPTYIELRRQGGIYEATPNAGLEIDNCRSQSLKIRLISVSGIYTERLYRIKSCVDGKDHSTVMNITYPLMEVIKLAQAVQREDILGAKLELSPVRASRPHRSPGKFSSLFQRHGAEATGDSHKFAPDDFLLVVFSREKTVTWEGRLAQTSKKKRHRLTKERQDESLRPNVTSSYRERRRVARGRCTSTDMYVDFNVLGWSDDIIYPVSYNAKTCSGRCPSPVDHSLHPTNHAILQSMMRLHDRKLKRPCCVPVSLKPLMMLYKSRGSSFDDVSSGNVEIRTHPDMVVDECGCR